MPNEERESVMKKETSVSFSTQLQEEYNEAVTNGFVGTIDDYCKVRDYT